MLEALVKEGPEQRNQRHRRGFAARFPTRFATAADATGRTKQEAKLLEVVRIAEQIELPDKGLDTR